MAGKKPNKPNTRAIDKRIAQDKAETLDNLREWAGNVKQACKASNIGRTTFYEWVNNDPDFAAQVEIINEESKDDAEWVLLEAMRTGQHRDSIKAAEIYLKARAKERGYGTERRETAHSGSLDINAKVEKVRFELPSNGTESGSDSPKPPSWETATGSSE